MIDEIEITKMRKEDAPAVAELTGQLGYPSSIEEIQNRFDKIQSESGHIILVARAAGQIPCGWVHVRTELSLGSGSKVEVAGLVVDEKLRGLGIGAKLMIAAEAWAHNNGFKLVRVRSNISRSEAHKFYQQRLGYQLKKTSHLFEKMLP